MSKHLVVFIPTTVVVAFFVVDFIVVFEHSSASRPSFDMLLGQKFFLWASPTVLNCQDPQIIWQCKPNYLIRHRGRILPLGLPDLPKLPGPSNQLPNPSI